MGLAVSPTVQDYLDAGVAFLNGERIETAKSFLSEAVRIDPSNMAARVNLAACYTKADEIPEAFMHLEEALRIDPVDAHLYCQLGAFYIHQHKLKDAAEMLNQALILSPELSQIHINYGYLYQLVGDYEKSRRAYERALIIEPQNMEVRGWYGMVLLSLGQWRTGLSQYEARLGNQTPLRNGVTIWNGEPLHDKTICVYSEQGMGDCVMCVRYLDVLRTSFGAKRVLLACPGEISNLIIGQFGVETYSDLISLPPHDYQVAMLSLPLHMEKAGVATGIEFPYIRPVVDFEFPELDAAKAADPKKLNIGFTYSGNAKHRNDKYRSIAADKFKCLMDTSIANWWQLQASPLPEEFTGFAKKIETESLLAVASAVSKMDMIVTVDTFLAHIAGAMDIPVNVMLPLNADWRWTLSGSRTHWYPSMRLFRQKKIQEWDSVFSEVLEMVREVYKATIEE